MMEKEYSITHKSMKAIRQQVVTPSWMGLPGLRNDL